MDACCLPCSSIVAEDSTNCGRLVRAQSLIPAGQVAIENLPTAQVLLASLWGERCLHCLRNAAKLFACVKCKKATYCSRDCQTKDWPQHKLECKHLNKFWDRVNIQILSELFVLLRLSAIEKTMEDNCKIEQPGLVLCGKLHTKSLHLGTPVKDTEDDASQLIIGLASEISKRPQQEISYWLRQFRSNNFGITDELVNCIGIGVYPSAALLNHSCAPNCILRYKLSEVGPVVQIVAIRDILPGEELTHSYIDCSLPQAMRRDRLLEIYGFSCSCPLCISSGNAVCSTNINNCIYQYLASDPKLLNPLQLKQTLYSWKLSQQEADNLTGVSCYNIDGFLSQTLAAEKPWKQDVMDKILNKLEMEMVYAEDETMLQSSLTRMEKIEEKFSTFYGPFNIELHKLRTKMLTTYLMLGNNQRAFEVCSQVVSYLTLSLINMEKHPLLGVQLFTLGDLALMCGDKDVARLVYQWCYETLSVSHIQNEELMGKLLENMKDVEN